MAGYNNRGSWSNNRNGGYKPWNNGGNGGSWGNNRSYNRPWNQGQNNGGGGGPMQQMCDIMLAREQREEAEKERADRERYETEQRRMREEEAADRRKEREEWRLQQEKSSERTMKMFESFVEKQAMANTPRQQRGHSFMDSTPNSALKRPAAALGMHAGDGGADDDGEDWAAKFQRLNGAAPAPRVQRASAPIDPDNWTGWVVSDSDLKKIIAAMDIKEEDVVFAQLVGMNILELGTQLGEEKSRSELNVVYERLNGGRKSLARWAKRDVATSIIASTVGK